MATIASSRTGAESALPKPAMNVTHSHPFTCNTCQVAFRSSDLQRSHMHNDWQYVSSTYSDYAIHSIDCYSRYNLKRRVASLPPISSELFTEKVLTAQATSTAAAAKASFEKTCTACQRTYYSQNAYQNHLASQKHKMRISSSQDGLPSTSDDETESVMSSTISLGEPTETAARDGEDVVAEAEFSDVVSGIKNASVEEREHVPRRPSRPHHSSIDDRPEHPLSPTTTKNSASDPSDTSRPSVVVPLSRCLFCNYDSPTLKLNVLHMAKIHGMFIPEQPYLVDLEGLVNYLYVKITELHECLYCGKIKNTTAGVQTHMRDKGHCMIAFESEEEMIDVGQFYDFRSTYSDAGDDDQGSDMEDAGPKTRGGVKVGKKHDDKFKTVISGEDGDEELRDGDENGEGWETDSSFSSLDSENVTAVPIDHTHQYERLSMHRHHSHVDPRPHRTIDGFHSHAHSHHAVFHSDYELHLPTGRTAGHRSLSKYYRQNLHNYPTPAERIERRAIAEAESSSSDSPTEGHAHAGRGGQVASRANGGLGMLGVTDAKKREIRAVEKRERKREQRAKQQYQWGVDKRGNSQKHFRVSTMRVIINSRGLSNHVIGSIATIDSSSPTAIYCLSVASGRNSMGEDLMWYKICSSIRCVWETWLSFVWAVLEWVLLCSVCDSYIYHHRVDPNAHDVQS